MKTLKQIKEEYDNTYSIWVTPEEYMLEDVNKENKKSSKVSKSLTKIPSPLEMPNLLLFRRISYRRYPGDQTVALYYSKTVDKYLSVPFGPTGNLNLSESSVYDTLEELELNEGAKWEAVKGGVKGAVQGGMKGFYVGNAIAADAGMAIGTPVGAAIGAYKGAKKAYKNAKEKELSETEAWQRKEGQNPEGGLNRKGIASYRKANPGSKLSMAVTTKPSKLKPGSKSANRRKSFCARMGGMKKRLTSAKTANDPDSRINKALRKWNCEEDFKMKLYEMRMQRNEDALDAATFAPGVVGNVASAASALRNIKRGNYGSAALDALGAVDPTKVVSGVGVSGLVKGAKLAYGAGKGLGKIASKLGGKVGKKAVPRDASAMARSSKAPTTKSPKDWDASAMARSASKKLSAVDTPGDTSSSQTKPDTDPAIRRIDPGGFKKARVKVYEPTVASSDSPIDTSRTKTLNRKEYDASNKSVFKKIEENKMSDLRNMIVEGIDTKELSINGRTVTLNSSMAKRILEVYDSVNSKNKKIVENMLNEDLESFKRLLTFSIRN